MKKSVHPLIAIAVVVFFGSLMGLKIWCDHRYLNLDRLWGIKLSPQHDVVIRLGTRLIFSDARGDHSRSVSLADFGITEPHGDFAFFSNGDLLTVHNGHSTTLVDDLKVFFRLAEPEVKNGGARLQRCSFENYHCREFGDALPDFPRSFNLYIDPSTQYVYIADTGRHQLWLLSPEGALIAKQGGFKFPNQLMLINNALWVADTNHHQVKQLHADKAQFGKTLAQHDVFLASPHIWPFAFAALDDQWWVLIADGGMANALLALYDAQWNFIRTIHLPEDADPVALTVIKDRILVIDNRHFRIYQFDGNGNALDDFNPGGISQELEVLQASAQQWKLYGYIVLAAFFITFAIAFAFALRQHFVDKREEESQPRPNTPQPPIPKELLNGVWVVPTLFMRISPYLTLLVPVLLLFLTINSSKAVNTQWLIILVGFTIMSVLIAIPMRRITHHKLGFFSDRVEVITFDKKHYSVSHSVLLWSSRAVLLEKVTIPLGKKDGASIYPAKMIEQYLRPFLKPENKLTDRQMMRHQWNSDDGLLKYSMILFVLCVAFYIFLRVSG